MKNNVYRFRSLKHGDPEQKLKMISDEGRPAKPWLFIAMVLVAIGAGYAAVVFWPFR